MSRGRARAHGPIWARPGPGERRPRYSREEIAAKALEIADAEGFEAVSMRRLARELRAGTMTLYHYVATKDDLLALMDDAVMAEVLVPEGEMPSGWREALAEIARRSLAAFVRHPWALEALRGARFGPNGMRHFEQSLLATAELNLTLDERFELLILVDDLVYGFVVRWIGDDTSDEEAAAALDYLKEQLESGEFPHIADLMGDESATVTWDRVGTIARDPARFERGLQALLDGIELDLKRRGLAPRARSRRPRAR